MHRPFPPPSLRRFAGSHTIAKFLTEKQLIMVFRDGVRAPETVEWTREEILREARKAATSVTAEATKEVLLSHNQGTLRARDIRRLLIDLLEGDPELLVRKHSILVKLPPLTAIVMHDRCFVFIPDGADSLLGVLRKNLSSAPEAEQQDGEITHDFLPFELKAIEAILVTVVTEIRKDFKDLSLAVKRCAHPSPPSFLPSFLPRVRVVLPLA
jgi:hypothetical protein